jgi:hypothetical protein
MTVTESSSTASTSNSSQVFTASLLLEYVIEIRMADRLIPLAGLPFGTLLVTEFLLPLLVLLLVPL